MHEMMSKVRQLREIFPDKNIQVDGGLNAETTIIAAEAGANCIVAGTAIFTSSDVTQAISDLRRSVQRADSSQTS